MSPHTSSIFRDTSLFEMHPENIHRRCCWQDTFRFCIDYKRVNKVTLRNIDDILDKLRTAKYITKLGLSQAYHQIPLDPRCREVTAFSVPGLGLFQFLRLPYGLTNAPAVFQRIMDELIKSEWEPYVFAYLDDVIIVAPTFEEEHIKWLETVLEALKRANLQNNLKKSEFCCTEVKYLGYVVNENSLKADEDKVRPILE